MAEQPQRFQVGRRRAAAEQGVVALVNERHPAARLGENRAQRQLPDAVHRIDDDLEPGAADRVEINQGFDRINVFVREIAPPDEAALQRNIQIDLDDLLQGEPVRLGLDRLRLIIQQERAIAMKHFEAIPFGRIVAGGKGQAIGELSARPSRR